MEIELEVYKPIPCKSLDEAIGRAYALSKSDSNEQFFVILNTVRNVHVVQIKAPVWCNEKTICAYRKGVKTVWP